MSRIRHLLDLAMRAELTGVEEGLSYGTPALRVHGKFLARLIDDDTLAIRCPVEEKALLIEAEPAFFYETAHYHGWPAVLVRLRSIDDARLTDRLERAWQMQAGRKAAAARGKIARTPAPTRRLDAIVLDLYRHAWHPEAGDRRRGEIMDISDLDAYVKDTFGVDPGTYTADSAADATTAAAPVQDTPAADQPVPAQDVQPAASDSPPADPGTPAQDAAPVGGDPSGTAPSADAAQGQSDSQTPDGTDNLADNTQATPLDMPVLGGSATPGQAADGDSKLVVTDSSEPPTPITADTLNDFITQTNPGPGRQPALQHLAIRQLLYQREDICTGVIVTIDTAIVRPRLGLSRASGKERDLINKAAGLIADHERQHRSIVQTSFSGLPAKMLGKTEAKARETLATFMASEDAAQRAFDAAHGKLVIIKDGNGVPTDVTTGPP